MELPCPRCEQPMRHHLLERLEAWTCRGCGGALVSESLERSLPRCAEEFAPVLGVAGLETVDVRPPLACPACRAPMARAPLRGIVVDRCSSHGTWYDRGELRQVLERLQPCLPALSTSRPLPTLLADDRPSLLASMGLAAGAEAAMELAVEFLGRLVAGLF